MSSENASEINDAAPPRYRPYGKNARDSFSLRNDMICAFGEFLGTGMFMFLGLGGTNFARTQN